MHIVYLAENIDIAGGIERSLTTRVNYLIAHYGYRITIICTVKRSGVPFYPIHPKAEIIFLDDLTSKKSVIGRITLRYNQSKFIISLNSDLVITVKYSLHNLFLQMLRKKQRLISEIREPWELLQVNRKSVKAKVNLIIRERIFKNQDLLIVLTQSDKRNWGFKNVIVIPNSKTIESGHISNLNAKQVLALGRLDANKAFDRLLESWKMVNEKHPDWKLKICGQGEEYDNLLTQIDRLEIASSVDLPNYFAEVIPEFLNSSIFVSSSQYESFGNVLVESLTCGVPVIAFDAPNGPREIITDNVDGFLVTLNDTNELAEKMLKLIENPELRSAMGKMAVKNAERFDVSQIMPIYNQALTSLLK